MLKPRDDTLRHYRPNRTIITATTAANRAMPDLPGLALLFAGAGVIIAAAVMLLPDLATLLANLQFG